MAEGIRDAATRSGLDPARIIVGNSDAGILGGLRDALGPAFRYSLDAMLIGPFARATPAASASARAIAFDTDVGDVGHVFWGSDAVLLEVVEYDVPRMHQLGKQLVVWTVNGEAMFRKLLGIGGRLGAGGVDMVITDRPAAFRARLDRLGLHSTRAR
jgi:glycerophosphoryl diester phosphodiesterase